MITEIAFTGTPVTDMQRARAFYEGVLGLRPTKESLGAFSFLKNSELTLYQVIEWLFHFKSSHTFINIIVDMYCSVLNSVAITCENAPLSP